MDHIQTLGVRRQTLKQQTVTKAKLFDHPVEGSLDSLRYHPQEFYTASRCVARMMSAKQSRGRALRQPARSVQKQVPGWPHHQSLLRRGRAQHEAQKHLFSAKNGALNRQQIGRGARL